MSDFFFEIRSGEIPAPMQKPAAADLKRLLESRFKTLKLSYDSIETFVGPRRLVAHIKDLATEIPASNEERRGPRVDAPDQAIQGFLKTTGKALEELEIRETPKGQFYFLVENISAQPTKDLLPNVIRDIIDTLPWPKNMTWSTTTKTWIRPIHGGCAVFDGNPLEFTVSMNEASHPDPLLITFNNITTGHRFMAPSPFPVKSFQDYQQKLRKAFVVLDQNERQEILTTQLSDICAEHDLTILDDKGLLDEVTGLVEWPVCLLGTIDESFMALPPELLRTTMRVHQRYFSVHKKDGNFAPHFILAANIVAPDKGKAIVTGNERVLKARLSDAAFFYEQDRKKTLEEHGQKLDNTVFHADLGSLAEKQKRLHNIITVIGKGDPAVEDAKKAASLCKADLMSEMVYEFPELQGIMGSYYAKADGENNAVSQAIYHQYSPKGPSDALPAQKASQLLALADRLDTLVGFFSVGLKPTGSKDPFALRRASLGIIRFLETGYEWTLSDILNHVFDLYDGTKKAEKAFPKEDVLKDIETFFIERLKVYWRDQGFKHDYINAVLSKGISEPLHVIKARLEALVSFVKEDQAAAENLFAGYKRARNIYVKDIGDKALENGGIKLSPQESLFSTDEEKNLYGALSTSKGAIDKALGNKDFTKAMSLLAPLRAPIDAFFENVHVNSDDAKVKENRQKLLSQIVVTLENIADFSKIDS